MVVMEAYCVQADSVQQQCETGKCILEDMDEVKEQVKDSLSRITQLVHNNNKPFAISDIRHSCTFADTQQAEGLQCNMVIWATIDGINQVIEIASPAS